MARQFRRPRSAAHPRTPALSPACRQLVRQAGRPTLQRHGTDGGTSAATASTGGPMAGRQPLPDRRRLLLVPAGMPAAVRPDGTARSARPEFAQL